MKWNERKKGKQWTYRAWRESHSQGKFGRFRSDSEKKHFGCESFVLVIYERKNCTSDGSGPFVCGVEVCVYVCVIYTILKVKLQRAIDYQCQFRELEKEAREESHLSSFTQIENS